MVALAKCGHSGTVVYRLFFAVRHWFAMQISKGVKQSAGLTLR